MLRRHFFLIAFLGALALMLAVGGLKLMGGKKGGQNGGGQAQFAQNAGGGGGQNRGNPKGGQAKGGQNKGGPNGGGGGGGGGFNRTQVTQGLAVMHPFIDNIEVLGVAKGRESVTITSNTLELVTRVRFKDRQRVQKGEILLDLQSTEQDANVNVAQVTVDQAKRAYERWKELANRGVAPTATME